VGWAEGMAGHTYQGVCRGRNEEAFLRPYRTASEIHRLQNQIDQNNNELRRLQSQLREADKDEARHRIRNRMRDLDSEQNLLRSNLNLIQLNAPRY
jgi:DNA-binding transcriptional regulator GbsR (MarR family)